MDTALDPPPAPPAPPPPSRPRLARNTSERVLGGVAAGIADHFAVSPLLVRLAFVVAAFFGGIGVIAYVVAWIVLPSATPGVASAPRDNRQLLGYGLVALGLATIPNSAGFGWRPNGAFWPLALVTLGGTVLWLRTRDDRDDRHDPSAHDDRHDPPAPPPAPPPAAPAPPAPTATATVEHVAAPPAPTPQPARRVKPPRGPVTAITLSGLLILGGVTWLVVAAGWSSVDLGVVAALALTIVGAGLVASAWIGRARGLVVLGVLLALVVGAFGAIDVPIRGGIGDATYRPATRAGVHDRYQMAIGRLELDFRRTHFDGHRTEVTASVGLGRIVVRVPEDVRLVVHGHAGVGAVTLLGRDRGNCCPTDEHVVRPGLPGGGTLVVDARVGAGAVDVMTGDLIRSRPTSPTTPVAPSAPSAPGAPSASSIKDSRTREVSRAAA